MNALVTMLYNTKKETFHPIYYFEKPWPGGMDTKVIRYKSKGHHTAGFSDFSDARKSADTLVVQLAEMGYMVHSDLESQIGWDGEDVPADYQIRLS